jgi:DMSO/TMAO reductase YedYZ molybdopterin-dependent catalytic subunit
MTKFILKKSYVNLDLQIEDVFENVKDEEKLKKKIEFSDNAIIINKEAKYTRATIEEIDEKTYKARIKKVSDKNRTVTTKDIKKD